MIYCFDIDGTICTNTQGKYETAIPFDIRIGFINGLYDNGHTIIYYTARGTQTGIDWTELTEKQLDGWGAKYHTLLLGKIHYDLWVDDKAVSEADFFGELK